MNAKRIVFFCLIFTVLALSACGGQGQPGSLPFLSSPTPRPQPTASSTPVPTSTGTPTPPMKQPVLMDTDMALDDWMALLFLLQSRHVEVVAVTISGTGETHCAAGVQNAAGLVALAGHAPIPIACGRETPLQGDHTFPQGWRDAADTLLGLTLPPGSNPVDPGLDAAGLIQQSAASGGLTILSTGPLTNLADALQADPSLSRRLYRVYIMGGAVDVPGNLSDGLPNPDNTTAEWNFYIDPSAANIVLHSGANILLVPLDATNGVPLTLDFYQRLQAARDTPSADFVYQVLSQIYDLVTAGTYSFWDPLAAGILADESLAQVETRRLCVEETEGNTSGRLIQSDSCPALSVAVSANAAHFEELFLATLRSGAGAVSDTSALAGTWQGTAHNGDLAFQITITIQSGCAVGNVCASFTIPDLGCSGDYRLEETAGSRYRFNGENLSAACTPGSEDWLELLPDGTLLYTSSHPSYGQSEGILSK